MPQRLGALYKLSKTDCNIGSAHERYINNSNEEVRPTQLTSSSQE